MKTILLPENLANEKGGGGHVKPPLLSFSADAPPTPLVVKALKTTTPTVRLESQSAVLFASMSVRSNVQQSMVSISGREENCSAGGGGGDTEAHFPNHPPPWPP